MNEFTVPSFPEIFSALSDMHFFYDRKKRLLLPNYEAVEQTWNNLLACPMDTAHHTIISTNAQISAICSSWRYSGDCWCIQNGIASNIQDYIKALVSESLTLLQDSSMAFVQAWFNPHNRIVNKMCGQGTLLYDDAGVYVDSTFCLHWEPAVGSVSDTYWVDSLGAANAVDFRDFIIDNRSRIIYDSEDFATDPLLASMDALFSKSRLRRRRSIDIIHAGDRIQAIVISCHSSPGISFSFLENRTEIIVGKGVDRTPSLLSAIGEVARGQVPPGAIPRPVITDGRTGNALIRHCGATLWREYTRRIWTKEAYQALYDYITNKYCQT